jgi:hypothetical protein
MSHLLVKGQLHLQKSTVPTQGQRSTANTYKGKNCVPSADDDGD